MKISESIVYVISQLVFLGGCEIGQERCEILLEVSPKLRHNFGKNLRVQNFTQTSTLLTAVGYMKHSAERSSRRMFIINGHRL